MTSQQSTIKPLTLNGLIKRLQDIRDERPENADLPILFRSHRYKADRRRRSGERFETSSHVPEFACSGTLRIGDVSYVEIMGQLLKDWN